MRINQPIVGLARTIALSAVVLTSLHGAIQPALAATAAIEPSGPPSGRISVDPASAANESGMLSFTAGGHVLGFDSRALYLAGLDHALKVEFVGGAAVQPAADSAVQAGGGGAQLGQVTYTGVWPGIDVLYRAAEAGIAESTYVIHPGGDPSSIALRYNTPVTLLPDGGLRFEFEQGFLQETAPIAWQEINGNREPVAVQFDLLDSVTVGFSLGSYDPGLTLFIDPVYKWHTFYGSGDPDYGYDYGYAMAVDSISGDIYIAGRSDIEWNGPGDTAPLNSPGCYYETVVLKLNSSGEYQWHTFYGDSGTNAFAMGVEVDGSGNVYVAIDGQGEWYGPDGEEPLNSHAGSYDLVVLKLDSAGAYQWHTFYGSGDMEECDGLAVDGSGNVYVTGYSRADWVGPNVASPLNSRPGGANYSAEIYVLKLDSDGEYQWHTFHGSAEQDEYAAAIAVDSGGNAYVTGESAVTWDGPGDAAPLHDYAGGGEYDIFVLKLNTAGAYQWHTFYGSSDHDTGDGITVDASGNPCVVGTSYASWQGPGDVSPLNNHAEQYEVAILKLNSAGTYQWHTFFGGIGSETGSDITHDAGGNLYVVAEGNWTWLGPESTSPLNAHAGGVDVLIVAVDGAGAYQWHSFYGADQEDLGHGIAVDTTSGDIYTAGHSWVSWTGPGGVAPLHSFAAKYELTVLKLGESEAVDFTLNLAAGWNMVSVPVVGGRHEHGTRCSRGSQPSTPGTRSLSRTPSPRPSSPRRATGSRSPRTIPSQSPALRSRTGRRTSPWGGT